MRRIRKRSSGPFSRRMIGGAFFRAGCVVRVWQSESGGILAVRIRCVSAINQACPRLLNPLI